MALKSTFLVLAMAIVALTSAETCSKLIIREIHYQCFINGGMEEFSKKPQTTDEVRKYVEDSCSRFFPQAAECVQRKADKNGCSDSALLAEQALTTGGACANNKPVAWMEDLLNRMGDMPSDCNVDFWRGCEVEFLHGGARLDEFIRCLDKGLRATCPNVAHFTNELISILMFDIELGAMPSAESLALIKNFPN